MTKDKREPLDIFIQNIGRKRKKERKETIIKVVDRSAIVKRYGKGWLGKFEPLLATAKCRKMILVLREEKAESFWHSLDSGGLVVNLAHLPDKDKFETVDDQASHIEEELEAARV